METLTQLSKLEPMESAEALLDLADTKLSRPSTRDGAVGKADVVAALCDSDVQLVSVVAPPGYGKTTLLASWADADPRAFAWVALDRRDHDPLVLLRYVAGAMQRVEPLAPEVFDALSGPGGARWAHCVVQLGNAMAARQVPFVLVLDDVHTVTNPASLDAIAELMEALPPGSRIAMASREEPALPLGRWRAQGRVHEVGAAELRLNEEEAGLLLAAAGVDADEELTAELVDRTEGWAAGLYLAALSIQAGSPTSAGHATFRGDDRFVADYFRAELMSRLPEDEARFLTRTSVLGRMCGGLCDSVVESTGSAGVLEALTRTNRFVVPLDRRSEWYRYHHLFGELLRNDLEQSEPEVAVGLNRRAMEWCIANDLPEAAVVYGQAAGESAEIAGLIDAIAQSLYYDGRIETLDAWLGWFGDDELATYPALAVLGAWFRAMTGRPEEAKRWLAFADGASSAIPLSDGSATIEPWVATLRAHMMAGGVETALADADLALDQLSRESYWRPVAHVIRGVAHALLGDSTRARDDLEATVEIGLAMCSYDDVFVAQAQLALLAARAGEWGEARRYAEAAQALVEETGLGSYSTAALVHVATARVAVHERRSEDARAALIRAHRLRPLLDHGIPWLTIEVGLEIVRAHLALAEPGPARTVLAETEAVLAVRPELGALVNDAREVAELVAATSGPDGAWAMSLTGAELRLLPYLATHLTFPGIATRLFISRNTVKSEAVAIYRKFGVSSRSDAIERAIELGLLDDSIYPRPPNLIPEG